VSPAIALTAAAVTTCHRGGRPDHRDHQPI